MMRSQRAPLKVSVTETAADKGKIACLDLVASSGGKLQAYLHSFLL